MDTITDIIFLSALTIALAVIVYFWLWCVREAIKDLGRAWRNEENKHVNSYNQRNGGEDD